ncbi:hypothetical protein RvY_06745 [Ramazzottius varieornatus]|uniref:Polyprenyldihydroxybenzoate methyltransferase n=1 Tax=Ramazzottius varieornatus TaxID=947166 RepID=A0A1D1V5X1_RAMVA|nr:hypothetical protein RvY_06745 [Ramazzottius varieornatus]
MVFSLVSSAEEHQGRRSMAMKGSLLDFLQGWMLIPWRIFIEVYTNLYRPSISKDEGEHVPDMDASDTTVDEREMRHWTKLAETWWDPEGEFALLRGFNTTRIPFIIKTYQRLLPKQSADFSDFDYPLKGLKVIDVGCGAGLVSEPLVELGADVTAVDMVPEIIQIAKTHWTQTHKGARGPEYPEYLCEPVEELAKSREGYYDMALCLEVLDHVGNLPPFVEHCCKFVRKGGCAIFSTFNRTTAALLLGIIGAEHLLRIVPMDTHHFHKFVKPSELTEMISSHGLRTVSVHGSFPLNPFARRPKWVDIGYTGVTYVLVATRD